ncbi:MAG: DUF3782 domain-containing protein, partial [Candidatus Hydrothermia bacterium]
KLNRVFEKLPPEHRDIMREAFTILIEEVINAIVKEIREGFKKQGEENERMWQNIERIWQAIDRLTKSIEEIRKTMKEGFERQEKENERIWQNIERIWQTIEELRKDMKEGFEKQAQENEKIWQAIKEGFERMNRKIDGLGARWGLMAEETFRAGIKTIIEDLGYAVENVVFFDDEGYVFLKPSRIEIDIIIKDGRKIAVEIKSSVSEGDVSTFERKVKLYEKKFNIKIDKKIILTPFANSKAIEIAKSLGIEILEELKE